MKTIEQQIAVMQHFADGGDVEQKYLYGSVWSEVTSANKFDWMCFDYRIKEPVDPYAELKAAAADPTKQIRRIGSGRGWVTVGDPGKWTWKYPPHRYEIRNKPHPVKLLAWFRPHDGFITWRAEGHTPAPKHWVRVPSEDKTIEVES